VRAPQEGKARVAETRQRFFYSPLPKGISPAAVSAAGHGTGRGGPEEWIRSLRDRQGPARARGRCSSRVRLDRSQKTPSNQLIQPGQIKHLSSKFARAGGWLDRGGWYGNSHNGLTGFRVAKRLALLGILRLPARQIACRWVWSGHDCWQTAAPPMRCRVGLHGFTDCIRVAGRSFSPRKRYHANNGSAASEPSRTQASAASRA
jgi:hypothetical protein